MHRCILLHSHHLLLGCNDWHWPCRYGRHRGKTRHALTQVYPKIEDSCIHTNINTPQSDDLPPGNPYRLLNGMDYDANICGIDTVKCGIGKQSKSGESYPDDDCGSGA